jgi:hypothetical protein
LMTIVTFLGAVVAAMLVFFFFQSDQIRIALRKPEQQRKEARIPTMVGLHPLWFR